MLTGILSEIWGMYLDVAVFMLLGFFMAGMLHTLIRTDIIPRYLGKGRVRPVFLAALFGIPIPLCSCGVIPVATGLKKQGANNGAALSFMIATPESGVDSILVSWAMLDPIMTVIRPVAAFVTAVATGVAENFSAPSKERQPAEDESSEPVGSACSGGCSCACSADAGPESIGAKSRDAASFPKRMKQGMRFAFGDLIDDITVPFFTGVCIAGAISYFVPVDFIARSTEHPFLSMVIMLLAGIPMYVCATSSTPVAAALILKGLNPGAALVFLLAGPATNAATVLLVKRMFSARSLVIYLGMIGLCAMGFGFLLDAVYAVWNIDPSAVAGRAGEAVPYPLQLGGALLLTGIMAWHLMKAFRKRRKAA